MRWMTWIGVAVLLGSGCHARFKKHAASLGDVQPQVIVTSGPQAALGGGGSDVVGIVVGAVQVARATSAADRLSSVDVEPVNEAFVAGLQDALRAGPPFGLTDEQSAPVLQLEVVSWGMEAPVAGMPGALTYDLKVSIYDTDGKKVYKARQGCSVGFGDAAPVSVALGTVDNVKQLNKMTNAELQATFEASAQTCGQELAMRMRKHASPSGVNLDAVADALDRGW